MKRTISLKDLPLNGSYGCGLYLEPYLSNTFIPALHFLINCFMQMDFKRVLTSILMREYGEFDLGNRFCYGEEDFKGLGELVNYARRS